MGAQMPVHGELPCGLVLEHPVLHGQDRREHFREYFGNGRIDRKGNIGGAGKDDEDGADERRHEADGIESQLGRRL